MRRPVRTPYRITSSWLAHVKAGRWPGVDYSGDYDRKIIAPFNGKVIDKGWNTISGYYLVVRSAGRTAKMWFSHLPKNGYRVGKGDIIKQGQWIGTMGSTGRSTGVHLHATFWKYGINRDLEKYV